MYAQSGGMWMRSLTTSPSLITSQKLFAELPEKMRERSASLQTPVLPSRKRPQRSSENPGIQGNFSSPDIKSTLKHEDFQAPSRARSFPHGLSGRTNKRNSMPVPGIKPENNVGDAHGLPQMVSQGPMTYGTQTSNAADQAATLFPQQYGNLNFPDLRAVMFPSDNPLTYPNQPMSTLEGTLYMSPEDQQENFSGSTSEPDYHITSQMNAPMPPELSFNDLNNSVYTNNLAPQYHNSRDFSAPMAPTSFPMGCVEDTMGMAGMTNTHEDFWAQMNKQGVTTGMNNGAVNLDELFGGDGWTTVWNEQGFARR